MNKIIKFLLTFMIICATYISLAFAQNIGKDSLNIIQNDMRAVIAFAKTQDNDNFTRRSVRSKTEEILEKSKNKGDLIYYDIMIANVLSHSFEVYIFVRPKNYLSHDMAVLVYEFHTKKPK